MDTFLAGRSFKDPQPEVPSSTPSMLWRTLHNTVLVGETLSPPQPSHCTKIASFDFDGTIAGVNGSHVMPKHGDDWKWFSPAVPTTLKLLHDLGYRIVIFSNQMGILDSAKAGKNFKGTSVFKGRVENVVRALTLANSAPALNDDQPPNTINNTDTCQIPLLFLAATSKDFFRKPRPGMWHLFSTELNGEMPDVGTAIDLEFIVPEVLFAAKTVAALKLCLQGDTVNKIVGIIPPDLEKLAGFKLTPTPLFSPKNCIVAPDSIHRTSEIIESISRRNLCRKNNNAGSNILHQPELIICIGLPASGKSSFVQSHLLPLGFVYVNQDTLGSRAKCAQVLREALSAGRSVVVDNMNPDSATRKFYVDAAHKATQALSISNDTSNTTTTNHCDLETTSPPKTLYVTALHFNSPLELYDARETPNAPLVGSEKFHTTPSRTPHSHVPDMVFHMYAKSYQPPM
ncbi:DNA 3'-phosphatase [Batrachochytrium salamandrivorans]|nr:DNA 3'-phosphatase [Batrachochytrium salamandrivorans]